jgi:molybdopterin synthase sulfur carrier subunit
MVVMKVKVKFFARIREEQGCGSLELELDAPSDVEGVWRSATHDAEFEANTLAAVNMEYVEWDQVVVDGDEVAFFPPVTGG